jgi:hypothetical protein
MSSTPERQSLEKVWGERENRPVILSYMDEAGGVSYQKADKSRFFIRSCVLVGENEFRAVQRSVKVLVDWLPVVGGEMLPFHAAYIYHGTMKKARKWEAVDEEYRRQELHNMADVLITHQLPWVYAVVDKQKMAAKYGSPINPHIMTFIQSGELVESWMNMWGNGLHWLPCVGDTEYNRIIEEMFVRCLQFGPPFGRWASKWQHAADVMAFTSPAKSMPFLLADLCAFAASRHEQGRDDWGLYKKLRNNLWNMKKFPR